MSKVSFQIELSPEEFREIVESVVSMLSGVLVPCRTIDQLVTIDERCKQRWPSASKKNQRRVRDVCVASYRERLGRHPLKLTGHVNGVFAIERDHLDLLDRAIDVIKDEVESRESTPLFGRQSN